MNAQLIESLILQVLPDATVRIDDLRGDGSYFSSTISSPTFKDMSRIERHRLIHKAIKSALGPKIDHLAIQTVVPGK